MIYLNHAGTSWPKPQEVIKAMNDFNQLPPDQWENLYNEGLETVVRFFNIPDAERFIFTTSCTEAIAIAMSDFPWTPGDRLLMSHMEHHSMSRWFNKLQNERGVEGIIIPRSSSGPFDMETFEEELAKGVKMVAISMACNVTGEILPYQDILKRCKEAGAMCFLDGAQLAGLASIDITAMEPEFFVFAGHKGPKGPQGIGGLYIQKDISMSCPSAVCEVDHTKRSRATFPGYCDTGSVNMNALSGLTAGLRWVEQQGIDKLQVHRFELMNYLQQAILEIPHLSILGTQDIYQRVGTISVVPENMSVQELNETLWRNGKIKSGAGFQCSPMAHEALGTKHTGCIRLSVGPTTTKGEIDVLINVLKKLV